MGNEPAKDDYQIKPGTKLEKWLKFYLDRKNLETYMNATASARAAEYECITPNSFQSMGCQNLRRLKPLIEESLGDCGVNRESVKALLAEAMHATKPLLIRRGEDVEEREVADHQVRVPALRLAGKFLGMEAPNKHEHSGLGGKALEVTIKPDMTPQEAEQAYARMINGD